MIKLEKYFRYSLCTSGFFCYILICQYSNDSKQKRKINDL